MTKTIKILAIVGALLAFAPVTFAQTTPIPSSVVVTEPTAVAPAVVVPATPAVVEAVKDEAWWGKLANQLISGFATLLGTAAAALIAVGVQYVRQKSVIARIAITDAMVERLNKGAKGIINSEAELLKQKLGVADDVTDPSVRQIITENATVKVAENFRDTLKKIGVTDPDKLQDFVRGRVDEALKPRVDIPAVMARS